MGAMSSKSGGDVEDVAREEEDVAIKVRERCRAVSWCLLRGEKDQAFEDSSALPEMNHLSWDLLAEMIKLALGPLLLLYLVKCCVQSRVYTSPQSMSWYPHWCQIHQLSHSTLSMNLCGSSLGATFSTQSEREKVSLVIMLQCMLIWVSVINIFLTVEKKLVSSVATLEIWKSAWFPRFYSGRRTIVTSPPQYMFLPIESFLSLRIFLNM
ncbi:uncharacterized protein LOC123827364 [Phyllostomus hastatus]|uniref:uncharacterized protein LOC123827364 n=1 Tax=Phyllostomus hastatus TaxID=9423 RepID=UPI001E682A36|nr:uncharacterized protein LOC123827364 [Phyllostomus hastatus]